MNITITYTKRTTPSHRFSMNHPEHIQEDFDNVEDAIVRYMQLFHTNDYSVWSLNIVPSSPDMKPEEAWDIIEREFAKHAEEQKVQTVCEVRRYFKDADFWLVRSHSDTGIGKPVKEYSDNHIGIRVRENMKDKLNPDFLFYWFQNLFNQGVLRNLGTGTTGLKHLSVASVKSIKLGM